MNYQGFENSSNQNNSDILTLLRDENFPKFRPLTFLQSGVFDKSQVYPPISETSSLQNQQTYITPKKYKKKKGVIFSQVLEEYCCTSPQKTSPEDIRLSLNKTAKKGILLNKQGSASMINITAPANKSMSVSIGTLNRVGSDTSIMDEGENKEIKTKTNKKADIFMLKGKEDAINQSKKNQVQSVRIPLELLDLTNNLDASSISLEEEEEEETSILKNDETNILFNKSINKSPRVNAGLLKYNKTSTPKQSEVNKLISFSEILPTAEVPEVRKNHSSIAGSLNDLSSENISILSGRDISQSISFNDIDITVKSKLQQAFDTPKRRLIVHKTVASMDFTIVKNQNDEKNQTKLPKIGGLSSFAPNQFNGTDFKASSKPLINGYNTTTRPLITCDLQKTEPFHPHSHNQNKNKSFSMSNLNNRKVQTPQAQINNPNRIFVTNESARTKLTGIKQDIMAKSNQETFYLKNEKYSVWYSLKEKTYKLIDSKQDLGLFGSAYCKLNQESIVITGGAENKDTKLVSSKVFALNIQTGEKESLPTMPIARYNHTAIVCGKNLFTIGGHSFDEKILKSCYMLDLEAKNWFRIPSLHFERVHSCAFVSFKTGNLYVIGGCDLKGENIPWIEKFDNQKFAWQSVQNTTNLGLNSKDTIILGSNITYGPSEDVIKSEEILMLTRSIESNNGSINYSLLSFDVDMEILSKKDGFQYKANEVTGFMSERNIYIAKKGNWDLMDVFMLDNKRWARKKFTQI